MPLKLHPTARGLVVEHDGRRFPLPDVGWDAIFARDDLADWKTSPAPGPAAAAGPRGRSATTPGRG